MDARAASSLFHQFARGWRGFLVVALIALVSSQFGAGSLPVVDRDEARFAQASRQMVETGDFVRIRLQDEDRTKKPIGIYWLQAGAAQTLRPLFGGLSNMWPYRLPSALGAVLAAVATLWAGTALIGQRSAFLGASLFAAGMLIGFESMLAKTDAVLAGVTTLAMATLAHLHKGSSRPRLTALIFWASLAAGVLVKGPVTPLVVVLTLGALFWWEKRLAWAKPLLWWPGPVVALLIAAPWIIAISSATDGRFFREMFAGDMAPKLTGGQEGHFAWPGFHTLIAPILIFPATYALPAAARLAWSAARAPSSDPASAGMRFLLAWVVPTFLFFELLPTKLPHYTLPALPALALLCGAGVTALRGRLARVFHPMGLALFAVSGAVIVALMCAAATFMPGDSATDLRRAISAGVIGIGLIAATMAALIAFRRPAIRAAALALCALGISFSLRERLLPEARSLFVSNEVAAALTRERLSATNGQHIWSVGFGEASMVFVTRTSLRIASPAQAGAEARVDDVMIVEGRALDEIREALAPRQLEYAAAGDPVRGFGIGRGAPVALYVGRVTDAVPSDDPPQNP